MSEVMQDVTLQFEEGGKPGVVIGGSRPNSTYTYIRKLLAEGFRGNKFYYRDNDRRLYLKVWEKEGLYLTTSQKNKFLNDVSFPDSISRARRQLREQYPDSKPVQDKRFNRYMEVKHDSKGGRIKRLFA